MSKIISYELYNPSLSIKENASILGCSEASIRRHIKKSQIDRNFDSIYQRWITIHKFCKQHSNYSLSKKREILGYSINTIKKYEALSEDDIFQSKRDTRKVSNFDIKNKNCIKSVSSSQSEILLWILRLYNNSKPFDADLTYSKGYFYKDVPKPLYKFDKYPQLSEVLNLVETDKIPNGSYNSIIYDLPFIISDLKSPSIIKDRFTFFSSIPELLEANVSMLERSYRLLKERGLLVVKTMDCNNQGKQVWASDFVISKAHNLGFSLLDKFILVAPHKLFPTTHNQRVARKYHSYFFVFRKEQ